jgi:hypothetical protein
MFSPISKLGFALTACVLMAACSEGGVDKATDDAMKAADREAAKKEAAEGKIECALAGSTVFARKCPTERVTGPEGQLLVIRHPDGGFRRFSLLTDGRGIAPADGMDPNFKLNVLSGGMIEVRSGDDVYRLPASIKGDIAK